VVNDSADVTSSERSLYVCGPATGIARLPTVDSLLVGTIPGDWRVHSVAGEVGGVINFACKLNIFYILKKYSKLIQAKSSHRLQSRPTFSGL